MIDIYKVVRTLVDGNYVSVYAKLPYERGYRLNKRTTGFSGSPLFAFDNLRDSLDFWEHAMNNKPTYLFTKDFGILKCSTSYIWRADLRPFMDVRNSITENYFLRKWFGLLTCKAPEDYLSDDYYSCPLGTVLCWELTPYEVLRAYSLRQRAN